MKRVYNIDWLSLWCVGFMPVSRFDNSEGVAKCPWEVGNSVDDNNRDTLWSNIGSTIAGLRERVTPLNWAYKLENHGTRQFRKLVTVTYLDDEFASVAYEPCSSLFTGNVCMVKFANRVLYLHDCWELIDRFIADHNLTILNITRLDLCCDFNKFQTIGCMQLIEGFMQSKLRHIGRGKGAAYFIHLQERMGDGCIQRLKYTGLSFGDHKSDAHVYLYDKSLELRTIKDKPYIRQRWREGGLDITKPVWRLEVSIYSKGMSFLDKSTNERKEITSKSICSFDELTKIYHTFVQKLFSFVKNDHYISNITREPRIDLWGGLPVIYDRRVLHPFTGSTRTERILIKQLHQIAEKYRDPRVQDWGDTAQALATTIAEGCDLGKWYEMKKYTWEKPIHK